MAHATYIYVYARESTVQDDEAVASVEMAVPPAMVAGEMSVETSEGETSGEDFRDGDYSDINDLPHRVVQCSIRRAHGATLATGKQSSETLSSQYTNFYKLTFMRTSYLHQPGVIYLSYHNSC